MKPRLVLALAVLLLAALSLPAQATETEASMLPGPGDTHSIPGTEYLAGPAVRGEVVVDVVYGDCVCGWR